MSILDLGRIAADIDASEVAPGLLLFGPPGNGKTWAAVSGGKPYVLLFEQNGLSTIRRANPAAFVVLAYSVKRKNPKTDQIELVPPLQVVREVILAARNGELQAAGFDRLVIDSFTELQRIFRDEILTGKKEKEKEKSSSSKNDDEQEDGMSIRDWGVLADKMQSFLRTLRSLPIASVCTALLDERVENGNTFLRPMFEGKKTASQISQYFSAVGFCARRSVAKDGSSTEGEAGSQAANVTIYRTMFEGPSRYMIKACGPVCGVMEPNVMQWIALISTITLTAEDREALGLNPIVNGIVADAKKAAKHAIKEDSAQK